MDKVSENQDIAVIVRLPKEDVARLMQVSGGEPGNQSAVIGSIASSILSLIARGSRVIPADEIDRLSKGRSSKLSSSEIIALCDKQLHRTGVNLEVVCEVDELFETYLDDICRSTGRTVQDLADDLFRQFMHDHFMEQLTAEQIEASEVPVPFDGAQMAEARKLLNGRRVTAEHILENLRSLADQMTAKKEVSA